MVIRMRIQKQKSAVNAAQLTIVSGLFAGFPMTAESGKAGTACMINPAARIGSAFDSMKCSAGRLYRRCAVLPASADAE